jgi:hypothetical protein
MNTPTMAAISACSSVELSIVSAARGNDALSKVNHSEVLIAPDVRLDIMDVVLVWSH